MYFDHEEPTSGGMGRRTPEANVERKKPTASLEARNPQYRNLIKKPGPLLGFLVCTL